MVQSTSHDQGGSAAEHDYSSLLVVPPLSLETYFTSRLGPYYPPFLLIACLILVHTPSLVVFGVVITANAFRTEV